MAALAMERRETMPRREPFDACVIGTGAGGGVMLQELTRAGFDVVALERGPQLDATQFMSDDELSVVIRDELFSPGQVETWRPDESTEAISGRFNMIAWCVGGTITHWAAWAWRFRPDELKVLSTEGPLAGASLADWPVDYAEMEPWYQRAEWELGVSGTGGANPFEGAREKDYPNPAHPPRATTGFVERGAKNLGYTSFPVPMAINSQAYDGRPPCMYGGACQQYGCPIHAKGTTFSIHVPRALATGRLDLRANARATEILLDANGRARGVRYLDAAGNEQEVRARRVIVAAGTLGTPHLLLMSKSGAFAQGLANSSGLVGRNLMFHHFAAVNFTVDAEARGFTGVEAQVAIDDLHPSDSKRGFIRGGVIADGNALNKQPLAWAFQGLGGQGRGWGAGFKQRLGDFPRTVPLVAILEDLPMESNRVDLDPNVKDAQGLPAPRITHNQHPNDIAMNRWFQAKMLDLADASGATRKWAPTNPYSLSNDNAAMPGSVHLHGTSRMGDDPTKSVVDRWCKSHDVPNLWVVDCGVFPTAGGYNPTLTLLAMAYRAADHLISEAKRQDG
jgi:choline dehydrogenase-like flavoprotein